MQTQSTSLANPFALLLHPDVVLAAVERSERLGGLTGTIYRPLDKPLIAMRCSDELAAFDAAVDSADIEH